MISFLYFVNAIFFNHVLKCYNIVNYIILRH